ncbi:GTP-binding protein EngA, putative [Plasmodium gaboni]|uniref:GTP-binding protein EngA, putative n=1 Tax=Plasmodium gaboni TaxID=647221 RepID=A0ABY1UIW8_9APIC|nr:GTP-binding protein EngA, putative [Plasmodium gaboni]
MKNVLKKKFVRNFCYKICIAGACNSGKSSLNNDILDRLNVSHKKSVISNVENYCIKNNENVFKLHKKKCSLTDTIGLNERMLNKLEKWKLEDYNMDMENNNILKNYYNLIMDSNLIFICIKHSEIRQSDILSYNIIKDMYKNMDNIYTIVYNNIKDITNTQHNDIIQSYNFLHIYEYFTNIIFYPYDKNENLTNVIKEKIINFYERQNVTSQQNGDTLKDHSEFKKNHINQYNDNTLNNCHINENHLNNVNKEERKKQNGEEVLEEELIFNNNQMYDIIDESVRIFHPSISLETKNYFYKFVNLKKKDKSNMKLFNDYFSEQILNKTPSKIGQVEFNEKKNKILKKINNNINNNNINNNNNNIGDKYQHNNLITMNNVNNTDENTTEYRTKEYSINTNINHINTHPVVDNMFYQYNDNYYEDIKKEQDSFEETYRNEDKNNSDHTNKFREYFFNKIQNNYNFEEKKKKDIQALKNKRIRILKNILNKKEDVNPYDLININEKNYNKDIQENHTNMPLFYGSTSDIINEEDKHEDIMNNKNADIMNNKHVDIVSNKNVNDKDVDDAEHNNIDENIHSDVNHKMDCNVVNNFINDDKENMNIDRYKNKIMMNDENICNKDIKVCVLGEKNCGKTSLIESILKNNIINENDIYELFGTRKYINNDMSFYYKNKKIEILDTCSLNKQHKFKNEDQFFDENHRVYTNIRKSDICIYIKEIKNNNINLNKFDKKMIFYLLKEKKNIIFIVNKIDLILTNFEKKRNEFLQIFSNLFNDIPIIFLNTKNNIHINTLLNKIIHIHKMNNIIISTSLLNIFLMQFLKLFPIPWLKKKKCHFKYIKQISTSPITFLIFTNLYRKVPNNYLTFFKKKLKHEFDLRYINIQFVFKTTCDNKEKVKGPRIK